MSAISLILATAPAWVTVHKMGNISLGFSATPHNRSGSPGQIQYELVAEIDGDKLIAREASLGARMPSFCAERHINPGGSFCLFFGSDDPVKNAEEATQWWHGLLIFLQHQQYADRFGRWPADAQMSHGEAAGPQMEMEEIATELGWGAEVISGMFRNEGWLADDLPNLKTRQGRFINGRSPCPRGCTRKHAPFSKHSCSRNNCRSDCKKRHSPILRCDCPHRKEVAQLIDLECERLKREQEITAWLLGKGTKCCGTMRECPLA